MWCGTAVPPAARSGSLVPRSRSPMTGTAQAGPLSVIPHGSHGLAGLRERAAAVGGSVSVGRSAAGGFRAPGACAVTAAGPIRLLLADDQALVPGGAGRVARAGAGS